MAGTRSLVLKLLADTDNFKKGLNGAENDVQSFGDRVAGFGKVAGAAFVAAGVAAAAYASKLAIDGVKAAIEDEAAQLKLATTLKNVTGATEGQTKAVEDYILKTELAYGVTDNDLRPSLDRLVRSTGDVAEAQKLQTLALNIAAGTGKDLASVSDALAKAHDGNFASLKRMGVSLDDSIIKSKDFNAATEVLATTFKDQASAQADTFDGKMRRLSVAFNEGKETIGSMILNAITPLVDKLVKNVIPAIADFTSNLGDKLSPVIKFIMPIINGLRDYFDLVRDAVERNSEKLQPFFDVLKAIGTFIVKTLAPIIGETLGLALKGLGLLVGGLIDQFANFVDTLKTIYDRIMSVVNAIKGAIGAVGNFFSGASYSTPSYGSVTPSVPSTPSYVYAGYSSGGTTININGAIDPVGTANQINNILATGASTSGSYSNLGYAYV